MFERIQQMFAKSHCVIGVTVSDLRCYTILSEVHDLLLKPQLPSQ